MNGVYIKKNIKRHNYHSIIDKVDNFSLAEGLNEKKFDSALKNQ